MRIRRAASILLVNLALWLGVEGAVRAAVELGWLSLPSTEIQGADRALPETDAEEKRLYQPDRRLLFAMRPNRRFVYARAAIYRDGATEYEVRTNEMGFRSELVSEERKPGVFRVACLGDSSTFGFNVDESDAYPQVLGRLLEESRPGRFEVLNFGVPGYSSRQGVALLRERVLRYQPDLVVFAYGTNDRFWRRPLSDDELIRLSRSRTGALLIALRECLDRAYAYRLLKRSLASAVYRFLDPSARAGRLGDPRVTLEGIRDAIVEASQLMAERGGSLLVLNNDFLETDAAAGIAMGIHETGGPFLDMQGLLKRLRAERSAHLEESHHLAPVAAHAGTLLFRVHAPGRSKVFVRWRLLLGDSTTVSMRDDGVAEDQQAGDEIWSGLVTTEAGTWILYEYGEETERGPVMDYRYATSGGRFRVQQIPSPGINQVDEFGRYYLRSDGSHPDEEGHAVIARELAAYVLDHY